MGLDIYWIGLLVLMPCVGAISKSDFIIRRFGSVGWEKETVDQQDGEATRFRQTFLRVYLLAMASEWLQGPYLYSLLHDEKAIPEQSVAILYVTGYVSAAVSALVAGLLADRFGRRNAGMVFCAIHSLASLSVISDRFEILLAGRMLGGVGLTLLWTTFESWMVTEHNARGLGQSSIPLSSMFGAMTTTNCITAILAGIVAYGTVVLTGTKMTPFLLSLLLDLSAAFMMLQSWNENYGTKHAGAGESSSMGRDEPGRSRGGVVFMLQDKRVWTLSFISCCFEGTIFLLMFYWPGALQEAHAVANPNDEHGLPYGVIFAAFMASMVLGAILFGILMRDRRVGSEVLPTRLLAAALLLAGISFLGAAFVDGETKLFCAFLLLELCNGVYVPSMAFQRGKIVSDSGRASVYGIMNIPLFVFVIVALLTTGTEGDWHRHVVFIFCAVLLVVAAVACIIGLGVFVEADDFSEVFSHHSGDGDVRDEMMKQDEDIDSSEASPR